MQFLDKEKNKVFISYTVRDGFINRKNLSIFKKELSSVGINTYIDLIDNNEKKNPQEKVTKELKSSDLILLLITPKVYDSPWVDKEIRLANRESKEILKLRYEEFKKFVEGKISGEFILKYIAR